MLLTANFGPTVLYDLEGLNSPCASYAPRLRVPHQVCASAISGWGELSACNERSFSHCRTPNN